MTGVLAKYFMRASELLTFVNGVGNVNSVLSITFDAASGQYTLFYT